MSASLIQKLTAKAIFITGTSIAIVASGFAALIIKPTTSSFFKPIPQRIQLQTTSKTLHLSDAEAIEANGLEQATGLPLALASADFDEDGVPDLLGSYSNSGVGFISFYRGNAQAIYPQRNTEASALPFSAASRSINLPVQPDFMVTGDFNADGHADVLLAARNTNVLAMLAGDGKGGFAEPQTIEVNGAITALGAGEINRVDGVTDFAVASNARDGASVALYRAAEGAWKAQPQSFSLAHPATSLAFAHLTRDAYSDLAIAAGNELVILAGGNQSPTLTRQALSFTAQSLAIGRFTDATQDQVALLARDGSISVASSLRASSQRGRQSLRTRDTEAWQVKSWLTASSSAAKLESASPRQLLTARVSGNKLDDLLLLQANQLQFVTSKDAPQIATATLEGQEDLVAALPLRTDASALQGMVLLSRERNTPLVVRPVLEATFAVNSFSDLPDVNPGDGICNSSRAGAPVCTLRAAIQEANATAAADTITFNIGSGAQTILLDTPLPNITNPLVIDGTPQGGAPASQSIVISPGPNFTGGSIALPITGGNNTIRGLTISGFSFVTAIGISVGNNNVVEGNTLRSNYVGVQIDQSANNLIGGTVGVSRNVIAANTSSGILLNPLATSNRILGNYIGTDSTGTKADGNYNGIVVFLATNNTIGGTAAGSRNVISGNQLAGVSISGAGGSFLTGAEAADGNVVQGNYIGVDANGGALGNGFLPDSSFTESGILISAASNTTIGGPSPAASNIIANNGSRGINIPTPSFTPAPPPAVNNTILNNSMYSNGALGIDLGATGVTANDAGDTDTGSNNLQNFPVLTSALTRTTGTTISGTLNSVANSTFTIELFSNAGCDPSGNGEGETFRGRINVTTNASGVGNFSIVTSSPITAGVNVVTATATDAAGNTSEFSPCFAVQNAVADLGVTVAASPATLFVGNNLTYDITVTNGGPDDATGVNLTDTISIPGGQFTLVSATPSAGTCTGSGPITCNLGTIAPNGNATVRVIITPTIPLTPPASGVPPLISVTATNIAAVTSNEQDRNAANNLASASATVNALADLSVTQSINPTSPTSGAAVTYTITITNSGPSTAANVSATINPPVQLANATCTAPAGWSCNRDGNPFFAFSTSLTPGSAILTIRGTLACLAQNTTLTSNSSVGSLTADPNAANNTSTLTSTGQAGTAVGTITYDAGGTALALGPIVAGSTGTPPSGTFTLTNTGCLPMNLTTALFARVSNAANLSGVDDSRYYSLRLIPTTGAEIPLNPTPNPDRNAAQPIAINRTLLSGQQLRFRILFSPPLPLFAGTFAARDQGVFATQVLPDLFDSQLRFNFVTANLPPSFEAAGDAGTAAANITARVSPAIQIVARDGNLIGNPATTPLVEMTTIREDFRVKVSLYDANKNATKITYQFFDTYRQAASPPLEVSLTSVLSSLSTLLPGQPFTLQQDFSGGSARPDITYVKVTVMDGDGTTVSATSSPFIPALTSPGFIFEGIFNDVVKLPTLTLAQRNEIITKREN